MHKLDAQSAVERRAADVAGDSRQANRAVLGIELDAAADIGYGDAAVLGGELDVGSLGNEDFVADGPALAIDGTRTARGDLAAGCVDDYLSGEGLSRGIAVGPRFHAPTNQDIVEEPTLNGDAAVLSCVHVEVARGGDGLLPKVALVGLAATVLLVATAHLFIAIVLHLRVRSGQRQGRQE